jgi:hydrogenase maturation protein HypF
VNTVQTSSCGRLFDAVAAILGLHLEVNFEGQAAIRLETLADPGTEDRYDFAIEMTEPWRIDMRPAIRQIEEAVERRDPVSLISARFHNTIAAVIVEVCERLRSSEKLNQVCLSGGTFQNVYLLERAVANLRRRGFEVYLHTYVPPNDGGLSLGQAVVGGVAQNVNRAIRVPERGC